MSTLEDARPALSTPTLELVVSGHVAELTLTRPDVHNRFDAELHEDFVRATATIAEHDDVRAVVLASTGDVFSAGGDFDFMLRAHEDLQFLLDHVDVGRALLRSLVELPVPVVAAVQGPAIGLGATVVLACDAVVAGPGASLADPHVRIGLTAGDGGCLLWPQALGLLQAKRFLLTGDRLDAERAYQLGLVTDLVADLAELLPTARALAERIAALPPLAVQNTKRALAAVSSHRAAEVVDLAFAYETQTVLSDDLVEAIAAFRERRPGDYKGR